MQEAVQGGGGVTDLAHISHTVITWCSIVKYDVVLVIKSVFSLCSPGGCPRGPFLSHFTAKFGQCFDTFFSKYLQNKPEMINQRDYYGH